MICLKYLFINLVLSKPETHPIPEPNSIVSMASKYLFTKVISAFS